MADTAAHLTANPAPVGDTHRTHIGGRIFSLLGRVGILAALATLVYAAAPQIETVLMMVEAESLARRLPHLPSSQAIPVLAELADLGPPGAKAIVNVFVHGEDGVTEVAARLLWEKVFAQRESSHAAAEAVAIACALTKNWRQIPPSRRGLAEKILEQFLMHFKPGDTAGVLLAQRCAKVLRKDKDSASSSGSATRVLGGEQATGLEEIGNLASSSGLLNPLRPSGQAKPLAAAAGREAPAEPEGTATSAAGHAVGPREALWSEGGSVVPAGVFAPETSPEPSAPAEAPAAGSPGQSFGPGRLPPALFLEEGPSTPSSTAEGFHDDRPSAAVQPSNSDVQAGGGQPSSAVPVPAIPRPFPGVTDGASPDGNVELPQNPWFRDRSLFCALSGGAEQRDVAVARLKDLGWPTEAIELGRLAFHPDPQRRRETLRVMWSFPAVDPMPLLEYLSGDPDAEVRREVLMTLATVADPAARILIERFAREDADPQIRATAEELLSKRSPR